MLENSPPNDGAPQPPNEALVTHNDQSIDQDKEANETDQNE